MGAPIRPDRTPDFAETRGEAIAIGGMLVEMPICTVEAADIPGATTLLIRRDDPADSRVAIMLYAAPVDAEAHGRGYICQLTPDVARSIGASLIRIAGWIAPAPVQ